MAEVGAGALEPHGFVLAPAGLSGLPRGRDGVSPGAEVAAGLEAD